MFKKHILFQILYIIVGPLCPASLKCFVFYKVPPSDKHSLLWLANWHSALWLAEHHKPCRKCNAPFHNRELQLSKLKTVNNVLSFTISSSPRGEQSHVTETVMKLLCVCSTQAAVVWPSVRSKRDISPSEGHFGVKTIMATILKCRSKPKCSKLATSKGPSEWRISRGTTDGHFGPPWSFALILCMMIPPPYNDAEGHFKKQLFGPLHLSTLRSSHSGG